MEDREARQLVTEVESRLERLDHLEEGDRTAAHAAIAGLLDLYGEALRRLLGEGQRRDDGSWLVRFARTDELVSHLLLLHGLHPDGEAPLEKLLASETPAAPAHPAGATSEPELVHLGSRTGAPVAIGGSPR
jgi:hypothetical protein